MPDLGGPDDVCTDCGDKLEDEEFIQNPHNTALRMCYFSSHDKLMAIAVDLKKDIHAKDLAIAELDAKLVTMCADAKSVASQGATRKYVVKMAKAMERGFRPSVQGAAFHKAAMCAVKAAKSKFKIEALDHLHFRHHGMHQVQKKPNEDPTHLPQYNYNIVPVPGVLQERLHPCLHGYRGERDQVHPLPIKVDNQEQPRGEEEREDIHTYR